MCSEGCTPCDRMVPAPFDGQRKRPWPVALRGAFGLALCIAPPVLDPAPRIIWNGSASAPIGLWRVRSGLPINRGDMVLARLPRWLANLAAARRYLPRGVPLLKRVVARDGDEICAWGNAVFVDGRRVALRRAVDSRGRPLPRWSGCERLGEGKVFLLMDRPDSFDGRYFGPVERDAVIGIATPVWLV